MTQEQYNPEINVPCTLRKKVQLGTLFVPYLEPSGKKGSQKGSLHVQEPKKVPYITKNGSKEA